MLLTLFQMPEEQPYHDVLIRSRSTPEVTDDQLFLFTEPFSTKT
jgi:hypothetical protein